MNADTPLTVEICWPTTLYHRVWQDHVQESPAIVEYLYQLKSDQKKIIESNIAVRAKSNHGLYESAFDLFTKPHPGLQKLVQFIVQSLSNAASHVDGGRMQPGEFEFVMEAWYHITNEGGFHDAHYHPNCSWCGIYYLQAGDPPVEQRGAPNGGTRFYSPIKSGYRDVGNNYLIEEIDVPIKDGMLLLFPSYLQHCGLPYRGVKDRIVIAFNAQCRRKDQTAFLDRR